MRVFVNINRKAAILAGFDLAGKQVIDVKPSDLTPRQRAELAEQAWKERHNAFCLGSGFAESLGLPKGDSPDIVAKGIVDQVVDASPIGIAKALDSLADLREFTKLALGSGPRTTVPLTVADVQPAAIAG